jgi:hypothetical protein
MGLSRRPKTNRKFDGSKLIVDGAGIKTNIVKDAFQKFSDPVEGPDSIVTPTNTPSNTVAEVVMEDEEELSAFANL